ncbi:tetraacyldisaccharide 4'-kinase [Thiomicrorhabdus sp. zzn3]|uniref:tetraacyldisaccharide 4'-kinase n=1 Tax=Thiomicrorhabdus sp. zzn3 TaxID=3039775 RepID=UPI0024364249|nr:tetraacyldisaccharide 4'-kinase [Thiomicrorhabdus sp. zzn3]MDG6777823.1 tetraacyldisaccharide 4'-kinase [Thiomicrorhabdus sp. zzn3]
MSWPSFWMHKTGMWARVLQPLGRLVCAEARRRLQRFRSQASVRATSAPVIVVGNVVVGGSGKTPFIVWLANQLQNQGLSVGIVSRGYGGKSKHWPQVVTADSEPALVGDEPVLLAKQLGCGIVVSPKRNEAIARLEAQFQPDVIISDDGLQHYAMARDLEIVMVDAQRGFGNERCLPAGPLREPLERLESVDCIVLNGELASSALQQTLSVYDDKCFTMRLVPACFCRVADPLEKRPIDAFSGQSVQALAGIGNPQRFYETLEGLNIEVDGCDFPDHHRYTNADFAEFDPQKPLLMTEKDAVKCRQIAQHQPDLNLWYLQVTPEADALLFARLYQRLQPLLRSPRNSLSQNI